MKECWQAQGCREDDAFVAQEEQALVLPADGVRMVVMQTIFLRNLETPCVFPFASPILVPFLHCTLFRRGNRKRILHWHEKNESFRQNWNYFCCCRCE